MMAKERKLVVILLISVILFLFFATVFASKDQPTSHHHFVLVHGGCLGAWSWYKLIPLLQSSGHRVTAIDLAASGINLLQANNLKFLSNYSQPLIEFMTSVPQHQKVILVAHSLVGAVVAQAMEHFPQKVSVAVFVTAYMPGPSLPKSAISRKTSSIVQNVLDNKLTYDKGPNNPPTAFMFGPKFLSEVAYRYSPVEDAALAAMLVRPVPLLSGDELVFSEAKYGKVKRVFIIAEDDQVLPKIIQKWMIRKNPPNRVLKIKNSDHMVMNSQPIRLLAHLLDIAQDFS